MFTLIIGIASVVAGIRLICWACGFNVYKKDK